MARRSHPAAGIRLHGRSYELNFRVQGQRRFVNLETADFAEAVRRAAQIRAQPELSRSGGIEAEIERFTAYKLRMKVYTAHSARAKRNDLRLFAKFMPEGSSLATVTARQVQEWHDDLLARVSAPTVIGLMMTLRAFFRWAVEVERVCRRSPMAEVRVIKSPGRARQSFCDFELRDQLIEQAPTEELRLILLCGFHAGFRFREIVEARPFWFDLRRRQIHLRKTATMQFKDREERAVPLTLEFAAFLERYGLREPFIVAPEVVQGKWLYRYDFRRSFTSYMSAVGICCGKLVRLAELPEGRCTHCGSKVGSCRWVTPHIMRHTFASLLVSAGESIYKVAVWMGDEVGTVQKHYGHLGPDLGGIEKAFSQRQGASVSGSGNSPLVSRSQA